MQKYEVTEIYVNNPKTLLMTLDEVHRFTGAIARKFNCGLIRRWSQDGYDYYDCGPRSFKVRAVKISD